METRLIWDETKRRANQRKGEARVQSFSYVMGRLQVLTVVHLDRDGTTRIVSYRPASELESEVYYDRIGKEDD